MILKFKKLIILISCISMIGCSTITPRQTFVVCKTIDVVTTYHLVSNNRGTEANPFVNNTIKNSWLTFFIFQGAVTWFLLRPGVSDKTLNVVNVPTCGTAAWNLKQL